MSEERVAYKTKEKPCPICGETIKAVAKKCIHCKEFFEEDTPGGWRWFRWTGFKGKTLWDVLSLLVIPLALALFGFILSDLQEQRQTAIEANRANANALQAYLDDMTMILLRGQVGITETRILKARTVSILSELDAGRNDTALRFLRDTGLITSIDSILIGARLQGVNLSRADLSGANLRGVVLSGADLNGANLSGANLHVADLRGAGLNGADLNGADLSGATLREADLGEAFLRGADLRASELHEARLSGADLREAILERAILKGAKYNTAPFKDESGITHQPTRWPANFDPAAAGAIDVSQPDD